MAKTAAKKSRRGQDDSCVVQPNSGIALTHPGKALLKVHKPEKEEIPTFDPLEFE